MGAIRIFSRFAELLDIAVSRAAVSWLRLNADGTVSERTAAETVADLGIEASATNDTISIQSGNFTAANGKRYAVTATATVTDPTSPAPANGDFYEVNIFGGTVTVGGVDYTTAGQILRRQRIAGAWATKDITETGVGGGGGSGWTYIDGGAASSVANVVRDGCFTDTYAEYELRLIKCKTDLATAPCYFRYRVSGADVTDTYTSAWSGRSSAGNNLASQVGETNGWIIHGSDGTGTDQNVMSIMRFWPRQNSLQRFLFRHIGKTRLYACAHYVGGGLITGYTTNVDGFKIRTNNEGSYTLDVIWALYGR